MRNPLRTEAEAFRFLIVVLAGAAVIVAAAYANEWLGVAAAVLVIGGIGRWLLSAPPGTEAPGVEPRGPEPAAPAARSGGRYRLLVVAPAAAAADGLRLAVQERAGGREAEVLVVVPALASPVEAVTGAVDERRDDAARSAETLAARLRGEGIEARGAAGADEPLQAAEDALREFGADEVVFAGDPDVLPEARERLAVPVSLAG